MDYQLQAGEPIGNGIRRIALLRIDKALMQLTDPDFNQDKAIHDGRKTCKRVRAILRLIRNEVGDKWYRRENWRFRDASRLLAPARDAAVMVETLDDLLKYFKKEEPNHPAIEQLVDKPFAPLRERLVQRHRQVADAIIYESQAVDEYINMLRAGRVQVSQWPIKNESFAALQGGLHRVYRRGVKRMGKAYADPDDPEKFHDWRKRVKYLWYQLEIIAPIWPEIIEPMAESLHTVSGLLGDDHDLAEFKELIEHNLNLLPEEDLQHLLFELIAHRRQNFQKDARFLGERLYADAPNQYVARQATYWHIWRSEHPVKATNNEVGTIKRLPKKKRPILNTRQIAEHLDISQGKVRKMIKNGDLPAFKLGHNWIVVSKPKAHVDKISYSNTTHAAEKLGLTPFQVRQLIYEQKIPASKVGNVWVLT